MSNFNLSKQSLAIAFPKSYSYDKKTDSLYPVTFEALETLLNCYPEYFQEIMGKRTLENVQSLVNYTGDIRITANYEITKHAFINEAVKLYMESYRHRTNEYKNVGHLINACAKNAVFHVVKHELGYSYIRTQRKAIGADGKPYKHLEYIRMSEQTHKLSEDGMVIDSWDLYADSAKLPPYVRDTAETACNNIAWKDFKLTLTKTERHILEELERSAENNNGKANKSEVARIMHTSHTVMNRKVAKIQRIYNKYMNANS